jgi:hypothetical protein
MIQDGVWVASIMVDKIQSPPWDYIKHKLDKRMCDEIFIPTIGDGLHHVFTSEYLCDEQPSDSFVNHYIKVRHYIAQTNKIYISSMVVIPTTAKKVCNYCGSIITLDKRGCCATCGAPPYNWNNET